MVNDVLVDDNDDLMITGGDMVISNGEAQNLNHLLLPPPGTYKDAELAGAGLINLTNSRLVDPIQAEGIIKQHLKDDKWINETIEVSGGDFYVDAER